MKQGKFFSIDGIDNMWFSVVKHEEDDESTYRVWIEIVDQNFCFGEGHSETTATIDAMRKLTAKLYEMSARVLDEYAQSSAAEFVDQYKRLSLQK